MKIKLLSCLVWVVFVLALLLAACGGETPQPLPTPTVTPQVEETPEPEATEPTEDEKTEEAVDDPLAEIVVTRTPQPTATPGPIAQKIARITYRTGLARTTFLGLSARLDQPGCLASVCPDRLRDRHPDNQGPAALGCAPYLRPGGRCTHKSHRPTLQVAGGYPGPQFCHQPVDVLERRAEENAGRCLLHIGSGPLFSNRLEPDRPSPQLAARDTERSGACGRA